jgi:hypothetical protein
MLSWPRYLLVLVLAVVAALLLHQPVKPQLAKPLPQPQLLQLLHQALLQLLHRAHATAALDSHAVDQHAIAPVNIPALELAFAHLVINSAVGVQIGKSGGVGTVF